MARTNVNDAPKAPATAANTAQQNPAEPSLGPAVATGTQEAGAGADSNAAAVTGTGPVLPADPGNGIGSTVQAGQLSGDVAEVATAGTPTLSLAAKPDTGDEVQADLVAEDSSEITIYPLRSYLDGKEVRRAGGKGYKSPKHDAVSLIAAGLATDKAPKS